MKTEITKRQIDGKYMVWGYTVDPCYQPEKIDEANIPYIPQRWIILGVYDDQNEAYKDQKKFSTQKVAGRQHQQHV